jgi:hypothetical protein
VKKAATLLVCATLAGCMSTRLYEIRVMGDTEIEKSEACAGECFYRVWVGFKAKFF